MIRLNRRENTQLELRLNQLQRQEKMLRRRYDREIHWKRLQLENIYVSLNESPFELSDFRAPTPISIHAIKMQRNQSAPPSIRRTPVDNNSEARPKTTPSHIRRDKRAMSALREITLKPSCRTLGNLLILLDNGKNIIKTNYPFK